MSKEYEKVEINKNYFLVQKYVQSQWVDKFKTQSEKDAMEKVLEFVKIESTEYKKFQYRVLYMEEKVLFKSIEKKPDNVADIF